MKVFLQRVLRAEDGSFDLPTRVIGYESPVYDISEGVMTQASIVEPMPIIHVEIAYTSFDDEGTAVAVWVIDASTSEEE